MNAKRPVAPEGFEPSTSNKLAVLGSFPSSPGRSAKRSLIMGLVWCFIGSACLPLAPLVANVLVAFGMVVAMQKRSVRQRGLVLLVPLVAGAASAYLLFGVREIPSTLLAVLCSYAVAWLYDVRKLTTGRFLLVTLAVTAVMVGIDVITTTQAGTSIGETFAETVNMVVDDALGAESVDLDTTAALLEVKDLMMGYWPTIYFATGLGMVICSLVGAFMAVRSRGERRVGGLSRYDVPLWVSEVFALGIAADLLSTRLPGESATAAIVGANVVLVCRIVLAMQGISVLLWWLRERRRSVASQAVIVMAALWVEMSFALTSMVGLLDTIMNFRHIHRGRPDLVLRPRQER